MDELRRMSRFNNAWDQEDAGDGSLYIAGIRFFLLLFCLLVWAALLLGLNAWFQFW